MIALSIKAPMRFSINGVRTPLLAHTLPVTAVSTWLGIDSSPPARALKPAPPDVLARAFNLSNTAKRREQEGRAKELTR